MSDRRTIHVLDYKTGQAWTASAASAKTIPTRAADSCSSRSTGRRRATQRTTAMRPSRRVLVRLDRRRLRDRGLRDHAEVLTTVGTAIATIVGHRARSVPVAPRHPRRSVTSRLRRLRSRRARHRRAATALGPQARRPASWPPTCELAEPSALDEFRRREATDEPPRPIRPNATGSSATSGRRCSSKPGRDRGRHRSSTGCSASWPAARPSCDAIAAITFTEKAGAELRDRLRASCRNDRRSTRSRDRATVPDASDQLDGAAIGTCTRSPSGSCPRTRSKPACRRGSRCSTRSAPASSSNGGGRASATNCLPTRARANPAAARSPQGEARQHFARSLWRSIRTGIWSTSGCRDERGSSDLLDRLEEVLAPVDTVCELPESLRAITTDRLAIRLEEIAEYCVRLRSIESELELLDALPGGVRTTPRSSRSASGSRRTGLWTSGTCRPLFSMQERD